MAESVILASDAKKNEQIDFQIKQETYYPTEFDLFILFQAYKIPTIIKMKGVRGTFLNRDISILNTSLESNKEVYIIIAHVTGLKKKKQMLLGIGKLDDMYKISKTIMNEELLIKKQNVNTYLDESIKLLAKSKAEKTKQDAEAQARKRKKVKKLGKGILPSE